MNSMYSFFGFSLFLGKSLVFFSDLVELFHFLVVFWTSLESNEQLGLLGISSVTLNSNGSSLDFLECGISISEKSLNLKNGAYLTRFSAAMTLIDTAFPRACNSMTSWSLRYYLPKKT